MKCFRNERTARSFQRKTHWMCESWNKTRVKIVARVFRKKQGEKLVSKSKICDTFLA